MIRSFLSLPFFRPPNAIFVPEMYFFGFSRYSYCDRQLLSGSIYQAIACADQCIFCPSNSLLLVGIGVGEALDLTGLATEETVQVGSDLVALRLHSGVALCTSRLAQVSISATIQLRD